MKMFTMIQAGYLQTGRSWRDGFTAATLGSKIGCINKMDYPITPAIRMLREKGIEFQPFIFDYVEKGGTHFSAAVLGVDVHAVIKTLVFETNQRKPLIVLMHGDLHVSTKRLARIINVKTIAPVSPEKANSLTRYLVGGTSPFGTKTRMPVYAEETIFELPRIFINGGKRGFLIAIGPNVLREILSLETVEVGIASWH